MPGAPSSRTNLRTARAPGRRVLPDAIHGKPRIAQGCAVFSCPRRTARTEGVCGNTDRRRNGGDPERRCGAVAARRGCSRKSAQQGGRRARGGEKMHGGAPPARHCGDKTLSLSPKTHLRKGAAQRAAASHDHDTTPPPLSRPRPSTPAAHRRPLQRRDRRAAPDHRPRAGRTGAAHLPRRTLEAPHQAGRLRGCRRGGARMDGARAARDGDARGHRGRHARARCGGTRCRHRPAVAGGPHRLEPLRRAGGCRRTAGTRHPRAGEEPRESRHRPLGRRHRAAAQRRHRTAGGRPPGLRRRRPRRLPQSAAVGHPHRAAPPHALGASWSLRWPARRWSWASTG